MKLWTDKKQQELYENKAGKPFSETKTCPDTLKPVLISLNALQICMPLSKQQKSLRGHT